MGRAAGSPAATTSTAGPAALSASRSRSSGHRDLKGGLLKHLMKLAELSEDDL
jgi:hypothetical protein